MKLFVVKEAPGLYAAAQFVDENGGPFKTIALFRTDRDARRFVEAGNRSMNEAEEKRERAKRGITYATQSLNGPRL